MKSWYKKSDINYDAPFFGEEGINPVPMISADQMVYWLRNGGDRENPPPTFLQDKNRNEWHRAIGWFNAGLGEEQANNQPINEEYEDQEITGSITLQDIENIAHEINGITDETLDFLVNRARSEGLDEKDVNKAHKLGLLIESYARQGLGTLYDAIWSGDEDVNTALRDNAFTRIVGENGKVYLRPSGTASGYSERVFRNIGGNSPFADIDWSTLVRLDGIANDLEDIDNDRQRRGMPRVFPERPNVEGDEATQNAQIKRWERSFYMVGEHFLNLNDPNMRQFLQGLASRYSTDAVMAFMSLIKGIAQASLKGDRGLAHRRSFDRNMDSYQYLMEELGHETPEFTSRPYPRNQSRRRASSWYSSCLLKQADMAYRGRGRRPYSGPPRYFGPMRLIHFMNNPAIIGNTMKVKSMLPQLGFVWQGNTQIDGTQLGDAPDNVINGAMIGTRELTPEELDILIQSGVDTSMAFTEFQPFIASAMQPPQEEIGEVGTGDEGITYVPDSGAQDDRANAEMLIKLRSASRKEDVDIIVQEQLGKLIDLMNTPNLSEDQMKLKEDFLKFMSSGHKYSFNNMILMFMQRRDIEKVGSEKGFWNANGRQLRPGETPMWIISPIMKGLSREQYFAKLNEKPEQAKQEIRQSKSFKMKNKLLAGKMFLFMT